MYSLLKKKFRVGTPGLKKKLCFFLKVLYNKIKEVCIVEEKIIGPENNKNVLGTMVME